MGYDTTGRRDGSLHNHNDSVPFVIVRVRLPSEIQTRRVIPPLSPQQWVGFPWTWYVRPGSGAHLVVHRAHRGAKASREQAVYRRCT